MNRKSIILAGAAALFGAALLFTACSIRETVTPTEPAPAEPEIYYASIGADSKTFMDEGCHLFWNADDRISVFAKTVQNRECRFLGEDGDKSGAFEAIGSPNGSAPLNAFYAASPYKAGNSISEAGVIFMELPAVQVYHAGSMDPDAQVMAAKSADRNFQFQNVGCALGIKLLGKDVQVSSVTLRGNADEILAGPMEVTLGQELSHAFQTESGAKAITLNAAEPVALNAETPVVFWMIVPPVTFSNGVTITVTTPDGKVFNKTGEKSFTLPRGCAAKLQAIEVKPVSSGAPEKLGIYPQYHHDGTPVQYTPATMQTSVFEADGKLWARFLELGSLKMYQLGPIPAQVAVDDTVECRLVVTLAGKEESSEELSLQVLSLSGGILTLTDGNDNYYIVRI
ncbi:MAG: hypothetical protein J5669_06135 [Bacteroidales bacterium]|nr:hypothetical protein [Bacteroidales bacterium]